MHLHTPIKTYFDADRRRARESLVAAFTQDATVVDEGRSHVGRQAIGDWWTQTKAHYQPVLEPLESADADGATLVRARVTGDFPGSPAMLTFSFRLEQDLIKALEIGA